ncbi:transcriptional regulator [Alcaligenaceae bacterium]|nr:transcriptional regulator [Alcaligenaceae bacterium]
MNLNDIRTSWATLQGVTGIGPIHDQAGYDRMVALADTLIDSGLAGESAELSDLFGLVSGLIADYDDKHHPLPAVPPREMLRFLMEQHGLSQADLPEVGSQGVVSEILSGRRMLNARQIAALVGRFNVSADLFVEPAGQAH